MTPDEQRAWLAAKHPQLRVPCLYPHLNGRRDWLTCKEASCPGYTVTTDLAVMLEAMGDSDLGLFIVVFRKDKQRKRYPWTIKLLDQPRLDADTPLDALAAAWYKAEGDPNA